MTVQSYRYDCTYLTREKFVAKYIHPVLVYANVVPHRQAETEGFDTGRTTKFDVGLHTAVRPPKGFASARKNKGPNELQVFPIIKRMSGPYRWISIGRTNNCDVVLGFAEISKLHGYFTHTEDRSIYFLADAGSTNGTVINRDTAVHETPVRLPPRAELAVGPHDFIFLMPNALYDFLLSVTV